MDWLRQKWIWANRNRLFWANCALLTISFLFIFIWPGPDLANGPSDLRLRLWGLALQLIGVLTVWHDLTKAGEKFGSADFFHRTVEWIKEFFSRNVQLMAASGAVSISGSSARLKVRKRIEKDVSLEDRVATLEIIIERIDEDLDCAFNEIDKRAKELSSKIKSEIEKLKQEIQKLQADLKDVAAGNLANLAFGAFWLGIGLIFATLSPEIVKIVHGNWLAIWVAL